VNTALHSDFKQASTDDNLAQAINSQPRSKVPISMGKPRDVSIISKKMKKAGDYSNSYGEQTQDLQSNTQVLTSSSIQKLPLPANILNS
jgi:hypothetical protein